MAQAGCMSCVPPALKGATEELEKTAVQKVIDDTDFGSVQKETTL